MTSDERAGDRTPTGDSSAGDDDPVIRVVIVDDQQLVRAGFRMLVESQPDMTVVAEAGDGVEALERLRRVDADVVMMDVRMPRLNGVEATREIVLALGDRAPKVLVLTTFDIDEYAFAAVKAGAAGFLLKDVPAHDLLAAIRTIHHGDAVIAPSTTRRLIAHFAVLLPDSDVPLPSALAELTDREREVLLEVAQGKSNAEIAATLFLAEATVKTHVGRILTKTGLRDRVQLVVLAYESKLVRPRPSV
jgi:DNA-binding NarL/FixJ family response regulator